MKKDAEGGLVTIDLASGKKEKNEQPAPASYETAIVACGFGKFHYMLLLAMIPMTASQLFSSGSTAFIVPTAECDLDLQDFQKGTLNGATYLGNLFSGLIWGGISDMFGRRKIVTVCFLLDFVVSLACGFAHTYWLLLVLKILAGVIIAGPNSIIYAYLAEVNDDGHRSMAIMVTGMGFAFCQVLQPLLAYVLLPLEFRIPLVPGVMDLTSWRVFMLVCAVPSLVSGIVFFSLPESPKFLMSRGRQKEALGVFQRIYAANTGNAPDTFPVKSLEIPLTAKTASGGELSSLQRAKKQFAPLFRKPYLSRIVIVILTQIHIMICMNSLRLWTPQLFALMEQYETLNWPSKPVASTACQMIAAAMNRTQLLAVNGTGPGDAGLPACSSSVSGDVYIRSVIIGTVGTSSFLISSWASKKYGNRPMLLGSFPLAAASCLVMIWATTSDMFMGLLATFTPLVSVGLTALSATTVDLFPTSLRGVSVSITIVAGRCASLSGNLILPFLLNFSCEAVFIFLAACLLVCSVLVWFIRKRGTDEEQ